MVGLGLLAGALGVAGHWPGPQAAAADARPGPGAPTNNPAAYKDLAVADFAKMAADKHNVVLDVRTPGEFRAGHIPGAVNLDVSAADFPQQAAALDKSKTYLVHCASGGRSVRACEKLSRLDFPRLYNLPGGFNAWVKAKQPVTK